MRCGDCKFWGIDVRGEAELTSDPDGMRSCGGILGFYPKDVGERLAIVAAYESEESCLSTKEDFGCVLFERKPQL